MCVSVHVLLKQQVQVKQRLRKIQEKSYGGGGTLYVRGLSSNTPCHFILHFTNHGISVIMMNHPMNLHFQYLFILFHCPGNSQLKEVFMFASYYLHHYFLQAEADLRVSQGEFDRQYEVTKLLLDGISTAHVSVVRNFVKFLALLSC